MKRILLVIISAAICFGASAQKARKTKTKAVRRVEVVQEEEDPRLEEMRQSTQKIIFIDSVVVDKKDILSVLNRTKDAGTVSAYPDFFKTNDNDGSFVFLNEMGNKCYYSQSLKDNPVRELFSSDLIGGQWTNTHLVSDLGEEGELTDKNYPFMMSDGITLYFAAQGESSIGGWDIFVTRYDSDDNTYLKAENIGMPFNSTANDYFYIVDDINNLGWFASDRNQPEGKVCVYTFIPAETRQNYNADTMSEEELKSLAELHSIKATWGSGSERKEALQRLNKIQIANAVKDGFRFVINDNSVYTDFSQFKKSENAKKMKEVIEAKAKLEQLTTNLEKSRTYYAKASDSDKDMLSNEILDLEQQWEELSRLIARKEKEIRNSENLK